MKDIPVMLDGFKLMVVEAPAPKMRTDERGNEVPVTDRDGVRQFVVSLFARPRPVEGQRSIKGEEIRVTLETDPGPGFDEDTAVALVGPMVSFYDMPAKDGRRNAGLSFKARGLAPAGRPAPAPAAVARGGEDK